MQEDKKCNDGETVSVSPTQKTQIHLQLSERLNDLPIPQEILKNLLEILEKPYCFDIIFLSDISDPPEFVARFTEIPLNAEDIHSFLINTHRKKWDLNSSFKYLNNKMIDYQTEFNKYGIKTLFLFQISTILFPKYYLGFINLESVLKPSKDDLYFFRTLANYINLSISYYELKSLFEASYDKLQGNVERFQRENEQRRELLLKVKEQTKELQQKHTEMEEFVYTISHDLKTPIISIQGFISAFTEDFAEELSDEAKFYLDRIGKNTSQIESMIREVLEYSRIGRITQEKERFALKEIIDDSLAQLSPQIQAANIKIGFKGEFPEVFAEKNRMLQLCSNLIGNSIKYMGEQLKPCIELGVNDIGSKYVTIYIKDNGMGIPENFIDKVFNIFARASNFKGHDIEGSGIGLAHCKKIVETHGGKIWVESIEKKGTTMFFKLPLAK
ncbi:MAG: ATP-binding protein [Promethearchaeota archaeon]